MWIGKTEIELNGKRIAVDTAPVSINSRTMIPVGSVIEIFGYSTTWKATERAVVIP